MDGYLKQWALIFLFPLAGTVFTPVQLNPSANDLPLDTFDFRKIRNENKIYVDKTRYISQLLKQGHKYYFLGRPARFGKSMFLNTLKYFFEGGEVAKDLFKGTEIYEENYNWISYPVLYFDFNRIPAHAMEQFEQDLRSSIMDMFAEHSLYLDYEQVKKLEEADFAERLDTLIGQLKTLTKLPIVVLIDEYDAPCVKIAGTASKKNLEVLKKFFQTLETADSNIKLVFFAGTNKYVVWSKRSSANIFDLSLIPEYAAVAGFSEHELQKYFNRHMEMLAKDKEQPLKEIQNFIKDRYNGYRFAKGGEDVYNSHSAILYLATGEEHYPHWSQEKTPDCVLDALRKYCKNMSHFQHLELPARALTLEKSNLPAVCLFRHGYLTIENYENSTDTYILNFPNDEVRRIFQHAAIKGYKKFDKDRVKTTGEDCDSLRNALYNEHKSVNKIGDLSNKLVFGIDDGVGRRSRYSFNLAEEDYNLAICKVWQACGIPAVYKRQMEYTTEDKNNASLSYLIFTKKDLPIPSTYIVNLKLGKSSDEALRQIADYLSYGKNQNCCNNKEVVSIGMEIDERRRIIRSIHMESNRYDAEGRKSATITGCYTSGYGSRSSTTTGPEIYELR